MLLLNKVIEYLEQLQYEVRVRVTKHSMNKVMIRVTKYKSIFKYVSDMQLISKYIEMNFNVLLSDINISIQMLYTMQYRFDSKIDCF